MRGYFKFVIFLICLLYALALRADGGELIVQLPSLKGTVFQLLESVAHETGKTFVYDSNVIQSNQKAKIKRGSYTLRQAVCLIVGNNNLMVRVVGSHIVLTLPSIHTEQRMYSPAESPHIDYFVIEGSVVDFTTQQVLEAASLRIEGSSIGSVTNANGRFRLVLPDSLRHALIVFSHLGYYAIAIEAKMLAQHISKVELQQRIIPLQEVVLRLANPIHLMNAMLEHRKQNSAAFPVFTTSFYREGIQYKNHFVNMSEGVFRIYKPTVSSSQSDAVELLKMRTLSSRNKKDSIVAKMKAGIDASLMLDIVKNMPDFFDIGLHLYRYYSIGMTTIDDRLAHIVAFEQDESSQDIALYKGELYIDSENFAMLGAKFEVNPKYLPLATDIFVVKKQSGMKITPQKVVYNISYKPWNGAYYVSYVRGDLHFKIRTKYMLFGSSHLHTWFEMATCKIDTSEVKRPDKHVLLPRRTIFQDISFPYDEDFWGNFNIIPIEQKLSESISKLASLVEETLAKDH